MEQLDLNLLRVLDAIFTHRTLSAAGVALGVTQPSVSLSLRRLRQHFGDELFLRQGGAMVPTAAGEALRRPVADALAIVRDSVVRAPPFAPSTSERRFAVALSDLGDLVFLPDLLARIQAHAPFVSLRSVTAEPPDLFRALADGTTDIALGHFTDLNMGDCFAQTLFEQAFVCLARVDHPVIRDALSLDQYLAADHAVVSQQGRSQELFERRVGELGLRRRIVLHSPHFMSVPFLVAQSDMITVVPLAVARIYARLLRLKLLPVPFDVPKVELRQFWHRRSQTDPTNMWLRRIIADVFVGRDPTQSPDSPFWAGFLKTL